MGAPLKESNALCALRQHMVLLLTQRAVQSQLKCALQKEVKNGRFLGDCPRFEVMRTHTAKVLFVSLVDHLLYIILGINTCQH